MGVEVGSHGEKTMTTGPDFSSSVCSPPLGEILRYRNELCYLLNDSQC